VSEKTLKNSILDLVQWIDEKQTEKKTMIFQGYDDLKGRMKRVVISLVVLYFVVWFALYEYGANLILKGQFGTDSMLVFLSSLLAALAVIIAELSFVQPYLEENEIEVRYERALDLRKKETTSSKMLDFTEDEKTLLKALIEIGGKNRGFTLKQLYDLDKTKIVFSEEKLLERLCKQVFF
jgi:uncharacterized membrane protein